MTTSNQQFQQTFYDSHYATRAVVVRDQLAHPLFRAFYDRLAALVVGAAFPAGPPRPLRVLDIGCGEGLLGAALHRVATRRALTLDYRGTDLSPAALELARAGVTGELIAGDAVDVVADEPSASRDLIVVKNLLHHLDDPAALLREARRVARPGASVVIIEACLAAPQFWVFSALAPRRERYFFSGRRRNLRAIANAGLRIEASERFGFLPFELAFAVRFGALRRLFGSDDPRFCDRVGRVDERLTRALPALASYIVWVTAPEGTANR